MARSFLVTSNVSIDLFNLPLLPDERRTMTMNNDFPNDFYLPNRKNSKISQIVNKWIFGRHTPDGKEGTGAEKPYLKHAYGSKYYAVDKITGNISAIYKYNIKLTDFIGHFGPFNLKESEFNVWRIVDHHNCKTYLRLDDDRRQTSPNSPALLQSAQPRLLRTFQKLRDMVHDKHAFIIEHHTNLYFHHIEVINDLVQSFQMYTAHMNYHPYSAAEYIVKQAEQASYYEGIIRNINIVLQMD